MAIMLFDPASSASHAWYAFGGAAVAAIIVYAVGSVGPAGATPLKLALAGAVFATFVTSVITAVLIFDQGTLDDIRLWSTGSLVGPTLPGVARSALLFRPGWQLRSCLAGRS